MNRRVQKNEWIKVKSAIRENEGERIVLQQLAAFKLRMRPNKSDTRQATKIYETAIKDGPDAVGKNAFAPMTFFQTNSTYVQMRKGD